MVDVLAASVVVRGVVLRYKLGRFRAGEYDVFMGDEQSCDGTCGYREPVGDFRL